LRKEVGSGINKELCRSFFPKSDCKRKKEDQNYGGNRGITALEENLRENYVVVVGGGGGEKCFVECEVD